MPYFDIKGTLKCGHAATEKEYHISNSDIRKGLKSEKIKKVKEYMKLRTCENCENDKKKKEREKNIKAIKENNRIQSMYELDQDEFERMFDYTNGEGFMPSLKLYCPECGDKTITTHILSEHYNFENCTEDISVCQRCDAIIKTELIENNWLYEGKKVVAYSTERLNEWDYESVITVENETTEIQIDNGKEFKGPKIKTTKITNTDASIAKIIETKKKCIQDIWFRCGKPDEYDIAYDMGLIAEIAYKTQDALNKQYQQNSHKNMSWYISSLTPANEITIEQNNKPFMLTTISPNHPYELEGLSGQRNRIFCDIFDQKTADEIINKQLRSITLTYMEGKRHLEATSWTIF